MKSKSLGDKDMKIFARTEEGVFIKHAYKIYIFVCMYKYSKFNTQSGFDPLSFIFYAFAFNI